MSSARGQPRVEARRGGAEEAHGGDVAHLASELGGVRPPVGPWARVARRKKKKQNATCVYANGQGLPKPGHIDPYRRGCDTRPCFVRAVRVQTLLAMQGMLVLTTRSNSDNENDDHEDTMIQL